MPLPKLLNLTTITRLVIALLFVLSHSYSYSQNLNWAFNAGSSGRDESTNIHIDNAGNVLITGLFSGITDFDPSPAVFNLTSAGSEDIFVAKYTSTGAFLWAFRIGGTNRDHGLAITSDASDNIIVTGFFRGTNIDFDPSAATANLTSNGDAGADPGYGGDIFVAKYNSSGQYQWAFNIGGSQLYDAGVAVVSDATSNIYVGGYFKETVDFDPSAAINTLNSAAGTIFLSKYSPTGNYQWAFNTGLGDNNNAIFDLKADNTGNVYVAGYFQGTNIDFDPSPAVNALSSNGGYEIFFAKYTTSGQYVFAHSIGGTGDDVARGIDIDNNGNIYVIGDFNGTSIDFDPGGGASVLNSNGNADVFLAKYTNAGNYVWAFNFGSGANDIGWKVSTDNSHLFITGGFTGTSDMNPSSVVDNLVSNGGNDIFLGKYNLNGEYLCAFNIGGSLDDYGSAIKTAGTNVFYLTGFFQGTNVDFDPTAATFNLSSGGANDVFLSKFTWPDNTPPDGSIIGSTICSGQQAQLTFNATAGTGPFTVVYNNGTADITATNVQSGVPFSVTPNPASTTVYTLVSIRDAQRCSETATASGTATVIVNLCSPTIINDYTPVISYDHCKNIVNVGDATPFKVGDTVLIIQMKGAVIDSTNTSSFGTVTNYNNAGNYEYNYVKSKNGNSVELLNIMTRQYDLPDGKVQLIRVPYYQNYTITTPLTCLPWDGSIGGVLVFNVQDNLTFNNNIDVSGRGFRGGNAIRNALYHCDIDSFYLANNNGINGNSKGEGICNTLRLTGRGKLANGGGGGNSNNSGGGGGSNGGKGGNGGKQYEGGCNYNLTIIAGVGGSSLNYSNGQNKIFLGGGGGVGHEDDTKLGDGGNGGGMVIISANSFTNNGFSIEANGLTPLHLVGTNDDGRNGGGGGGTILLNFGSSTGNLQLSVKGGKGEDCIATPVMNFHGPGGGGGGGVVWINKPIIPSNFVIDATGGVNGVNVNQGNNPWGATAGENGISLTNLVLPVSAVLFKPNIDSVRIKDSLTTCTDFDFNGLAYTNTNPIASWQWYFGDGQTGNTQNTTHTYAPGNYTVKLIITDINGCKDSITTNIIASTLTVDAGNDTTICSGQSVTLLATTNGGTQFQWNNSSLLNSNAILNPTATPTAASTTFTITATNAAGCSKTDSVQIIVRSQNNFSINAPSPICPNGTAQLTAQGGDTYQWQPSGGISSTIPNPVVSPSATTTYTVQITDTVCNQTQNLSTQVVVLSLPNVQAFKQNDIDCLQNTSRLNATGAVNYKWMPSASLSNPNIANPIATPTATTIYTVEGTDASGCKNSDTVSVAVDFTVKNGSFLVPNAFTPNNDGLNDCFGIKHWGVLEQVEFNIYNRWGELVFHTTDATKCWDGKWKGRDQDPAVFVYWIKAKSICGGNVFRKGTVVLIR